MLWRFLVSCTSGKVLQEIDVSAHRLRQQQTERKKGKIGSSQVQVVRCLPLHCQKSQLSVPAEVHAESGQPYTVMAGNLFHRSGSHWSLDNDP